MSEIKIYNVGDEVRLIEIGKEDAFYEDSNSLIGLVGEVCDYPLTCKEGSEQYTGQLIIKFNLKPLFMHNPKYTKYTEYYSRINQIK